MQGFTELRGYCSGISPDLEHSLLTGRRIRREIILAALGTDFMPGILKKNRDM